LAQVGLAQATHLEKELCTQVLVAPLARLPSIMVLRGTWLLLLPASVMAHGRLTMPVNRQGGSLAVAGTSCQKFPENVNMCGYFSAEVKHPGPVTVCDTNFLTTNMRHVIHGGCDTPDQNKYRLAAPWRSPGTTNVFSPCGNNNGSPGGTDGRTLPQTNRTHWQRGTSVKVAFTVTVNHGGGYIFRLCPAQAEQTEECFQKNSLKFADDVTVVHFVDGSETSIQAFRTTNGTHPPGSQWAMNPIPISTAVFPAPCSGCQGGKWRFSLIDRVVLPKELPTGDYTLSWRWDNENQPQVWNNCADVTITDKPSSTLLV